MFEFDDKPHDECGVFGIFAPGRQVARMTFFGLYALQHRGQESAGVVTSDGIVAHQHKGMGLVAQVFNEDNLAPLEGHLAIGHTRYSTTGSAKLRNAQPYLIETINGPLGVSHYGILTNALDLRRQLLERGVGLSSTTDSEAITQILAAPPAIWGEAHNPQNGADIWVSRIRGLMRVAQGAYTLAILTRHAVYGVRDPLGLRPLCIGELDGGGHVIASESCALETIGAHYVREVEPGEIVRLDTSGITSIRGMIPERKRSLCIFEFVYFARPDSRLDDAVVHEVRQQMGRRLAQEAPVEADAVIGVPDSATPHSIGYAAESGIVYTEGLTKNRYIGRTFIQPDDDLRQVGVQLKYNALTANLQGKRVIMIDDSIVSGNTCGPLVQLLREAGASEGHVRVASPPVRHPCFMGIDMATYNVLIASNMDIEGIRQHIGADSLFYLSLPGMVGAVQEVVGGDQGYC
ncbi:MAG: amidophosphoribosyltransferase, partial [Anaerolineae bacterium]